MQVIVSPSHSEMPNKCQINTPDFTPNTTERGMMIDSISLAESYFLPDYLLSL